MIELKDESIIRHQAQITLNATTGEVFKSTRNESVIATLNAGIYGLQMAHFADPILRIGLFFSGLLGCAMIASGLLLWSLKRQLQNKFNKFHFGHFLVNRLNIAVIIGLPKAMLAYLYANRIIVMSAGSPNYEVYIFFSVWLNILIFASLTPKYYLWKMHLKILIFAALHRWIWFVALRIKSNI